MPETAARGDLTNNQSPNFSFTATLLLPPPTVPPGYKAAVHVFSLLMPPSVWTLFNLYVNLQLHAIPPEYMNLVSLSISYFILFVIIAVVTLIYYALAGGFEWRPTSLPVTRFVIYLIVSGLFPGLLFVAYWLFIRSLFGSVFRLDGVSAMGRLFRVREI